MPDSIIDLRSDTVTRPTAAMRDAMLAAEVGDDVFGDDPTVNRLQDRVAELLGKEAALFVPSGTMSNQIALRAQTEPGDEILCDATCHIYLYEAGGPAVHSGLMCQTVAGRYGILELAQLENLIRPDNEHLVRTRMVCLENTHNRGGGKVYPLDKIRAITDWARDHGLLMHLDGARLMNAVVATGITAREYSAPFDSVSLCFSKGLGAPVGSALAGSRVMIQRGRKIRKLFGGGMRQAGILAAAALYALDRHVERLAEDHANARLLADAARGIRGISLDPPEIDTNLVFIDIDPRLAAANQIVERLAEQGVRCLPLTARSIRLCTHLDVTRAQAERGAEVLSSTLRSFASRASF